MEALHGGPHRERVAAECDLKSTVPQTNTSFSFTRGTLGRLPGQMPTLPLKSASNCMDRLAGDPVNMLKSLRKARASTRVRRPAAAVTPEGTIANAADLSSAHVLTMAEPITGRTQPSRSA